jgi:hypothetical protein
MCPSGHVWLCFFLNQPIKLLNVCVAIIKKLERHVDILPVVCSVADYEFIWAWPLIGFCQMLGGECSVL